MTKFLVKYLICLTVLFTSLNLESRIVDTIEALQEKKMGEASAKIEMLEFASLTCGHCAKFHNEVFPKIKKEYIDTGKILFTYKDFPLDKFALKASVIARCSGNDKFFSFLKVLYNKQKDWTRTQDPFKSLLKIAKLGGLKNDEIKVCVGNKSIEDGILKQRLSSSKKFDIKATPTIFFNGKKYDGDLTYEALKLKINSLLN
ncbi:MAG: disulfide bond formation protein DsbA [Rickettsiales bacterium]|nr:disulfide bond formation protein DsbA [Rickettsiales bacterium]|tara:strand:- start:330 stop:935 length:606 start_codon:yes stop_codon:yes gene_type:complete